MSPLTYMSDRVAALEPVQYLAHTLRERLNVDADTAMYLAAETLTFTARLMRSGAWNAARDGLLQPDRDLLDWLDAHGDVRLSLHPVANVALLSGEAASAHAVNLQESERLGMPRPLAYTLSTIVFTQRMLEPTRPLGLMVDAVTHAQDGSGRVDILAGYLAELLREAFYL